ncbi:MAG: hypothetical protein GY730_03240 [bacterium]|nr:hypothetical protein [bacterium]
MSRRIDDFEQEQIEKIKNNSYYRKVQQQIKEKQSLKKNTEDSVNQKKEHKAQKLSQQGKVTNIAKLEASNNINIKDTVHLSSFSWEKDERENIDTIDKKAQDSISKKRSRESKVLKSLKKLGFKIDLTSNVVELKESYMQNTIQAKSSNSLLARYARFKLGIIGQILSLIGVMQEDLRHLQKKAIETAIEENLSLMAENIYNMELTELVYGNRKKVRRTLAMYAEVENQLITQMIRLGSKYNWTRISLLEERIKQCRKIQEEFQNEKNALAYHLEFIKQKEIAEYFAERKRSSGK